MRKILIVLFSFFVFNCSFSIGNKNNLNSGSIDTAWCIEIEDRKFMTKYIEFDKGTSCFSFYHVNDNILLQSIYCPVKQNVILQRCR